MLAAVPGPGTVDRRFVISPNRSLSWRGNCLFIALVSAVLFTIALGFALVGLWMVAPFAGLELLAVVAAFHFLRHRGAVTEIVEVSDPFVTVSVARERLERSSRLPRNQSRVILNPPPVRGHPSRLFISSRDLGIELGRCLGEEERRSLAAALRAAIHRPADPAAGA